MRKICGSLFVILATVLSVEIAFDTKFDPKATGLVALFVSTQAPTDELVFRNFRLARAK